MGQLLTTKWLPYMGALAIQGFAATIPVVTVAPTSVVTVTSTYSDTVTSTITGVLPVTTVETTCTPGSVAPESCSNSIWSAKGSYWQEWCSDSSLEGAPFMTIHGATSPYECFVFCGIYSSCQGLNWDDNDECVLLTDITSTVEVTSSHWAAIERFSTNPCVVTVTGASTQLSTETTVMEYTTTYTSTITLSTSASVASTSPTSSVATSTYISSVSTSTASACTVSALPTTTDCVDGYYVYNEEYYQVLCSDTMRSYSGFLPNSRQADIWGCIEVCSTYSNCIGTFWFLGICYSESGAIDYSYVPYDFYYCTNLFDNPIFVHTCVLIGHIDFIKPYRQIYASRAICINCFPFHSFKRLSVSCDNEIVYFIGPVNTNVPGLKLQELSFSRLLCCRLNSPSFRPLEELFRTYTSATVHFSSVSFISFIICVIAASFQFFYFSKLYQQHSRSFQSKHPSVSPAHYDHFYNRDPYLSHYDLSSEGYQNGFHSTTSRCYLPCRTKDDDFNCLHHKGVHYYRLPSMGLKLSCLRQDNQLHNRDHSPTSSNGGVSTEQPQALTTSTVFTTKVHTMAGCPQRSPHCAASEKTTYYTTETIAAYTTICPVAAEETGTHASGQATAIGEGSIGPSSERLSTSTVYTTRVYPTTVCLSSSTTCADTERTTYFTTETAVASVSVITSAAVDTAADNSGAQVTPSGGESSASTITAVLYTTEVYMNTKGTKTYFTTSTIPITTTMTPTASEIPQFSPTSEARSALLGPHSSQQGVSGASTIGSGADADGQIGPVVLDHPLTFRPGLFLVSDQLSAAVLMLVLGAMDLILWVSRLLVSGSIALPLEVLLEVTLRPTLGSIAGSHTASVYASGTSTVVSAQYTGSAARSAVWTWLPFVGVVIGYFL
ncbi:hypothetical protein AKAW_08552 [Aspergillus niger]|uniref:Apple domain-containing protein n=1 Tax=Aspergillus niger TaxID=5061 RepID=A0A100IGX7_ASPNG|nr:hypothetical protein AKAW_08552 [Aspergillus niger]